MTLLPRSLRGKLMALFNAVSLISLNPEALGGSSGFYDNPIMVGL